MNNITTGTLTRDVEVPHINGGGGHVVPAGSTVQVTFENDESIYISGPEVRATVYVERSAVRITEAYRPEVREIHRVEWVEGDSLTMECSCGERFIDGISAGRHEIEANDR